MLKRTNFKWANAFTFTDQERFNQKPPCPLFTVVYDWASAIISVGISRIKPMSKDALVCKDGIRRVGSLNIWKLMEQSTWT